MAAHRDFRISVIRALAVGLPGVAIVPFVVVPPPGVPSALLAINPLVMLVAASVLGCWAASRMGLRSLLIFGDAVDWGILWRYLVAAIVIGLAISLTDDALAPLWRGEATQPATISENVGLGSLALGVLYGGMTEEVLFRWGLLSSLAAALGLVVSGRLSLQLAVLLASILFALSHLPVLAAAGVDLSPAIVARTLGWNGLLGLLFGYAFIRNNLETAMASHAGFHLGTAILPATAAIMP